MSSIVYEIERKISRKHTYITIRKDSQVVVKTNFTTTKNTIDSFIEKKRNWILKHKNKILQAQKAAREGVWILGKFHTNHTYTKDELDLLYEKEATRIIPPMVDIYSQKMQLFANKIGFRKNRTRWGSCSGKNNLSFNIYLAKTPVEFIEYVVVHELAHIKYKNHSKEFWQLVRKYLPDYRLRQNIVKDNYFL